MTAQFSAPISAVLKLTDSVTVRGVTDALKRWLRDVHGVGLASAEYPNLIVEWRSVEGHHPSYQLIATDSQSFVRRTITGFRDHEGFIVVVEELPLSTVDTPRAAVDISPPLRLLLQELSPMTPDLAGLRRDVINDFSRCTPKLVVERLSHELAPGAVLAVTPHQGAPLTSIQSQILESLRGLAAVGYVPAKSGLLTEVGLTIEPKPGSVLSLTRSRNALEALVIGSTSLRTKVDSARRLIVRKQLSVPIPFDLERRRSAAVAKLLTSGPEVDLPTALHLLDEENRRANDLNNRVNELEALLEIAYAEQDHALSELDDAQSQVRFLEKAFRDLGEVPFYQEAEDETWNPDSCSYTLEAARDSLQYLVIGPTDQYCQILDKQQKRAIWAKKIWSALRALNDYCRAKSDGLFSGDITMYRDNPPNGTIPLLSEFAARESQSTGNDTYLRGLRTFAVPTIVDPSGSVYMQQHVKIDQGGSSAPRIHLHDDSTGSTQRVHIGYIGPHLATSSGF